MSQPVAEPVRSLRMPGRGLARTGRLLVHLTWWDMVSSYFGSWVGVLWNFLLPALVIVVYLAVFELTPGFRFGGHESVGGYGINLVVGLIPWLLFQEAVTRAAGVFVDYRHVLTQVPVPPLLFPLATVGSALLRHVVILALFALFIAAQGITPNLLWLGVLGVLPIAVLVSVGAALTAACATVLHRDVAPTVGAAMLPLFFATPIIYPPQIVPGALRFAMDINPLSPIVVAYRDLLLVGRTPEPTGLLYSLGIGLLATALGLLLVRRIGPELPERL